MRRFDNIHKRHNKKKKKEHNKKMHPTGSHVRFSDVYQSLPLAQQLR